MFCFIFWKHFKLNVSLHQNILLFQCFLLFAQLYFFVFYNELPFVIKNELFLIL